MTYNVRVSSGLEHASLLSTGMGNDRSDLGSVFGSLRFQ
jgi:hypothetical protein